MNRRAAVVLLAALAVCVGGLLVWQAFRSQDGGPRRPRAFLRVSPAGPALTPAAGPAPTPGETVRVTLFFPAAADSRLRPEERDIARPSGPSAYLRALFAELQKGPNQPGLLGPMPDKIRLRNAFLLPEGQAVLDLSVDAGLAFGSGEELTIVASVVDTVLQNVADTTHVRILVNGEPAETLGGHVDLTRPLLFIRRELAP
ncbi:MAG: GerMN domain-containing protein [Thermoanaerobaculia bacterium]